MKRVSLFFVSLLVMSLLSLSVKCFSLGRARAGDWRVRTLSVALQSSSKDALSLSGARSLSAVVHRLNKDAKKSSPQSQAQKQQQQQRIKTGPSKPLQKERVKVSSSKITHTDKQTKNDTITQADIPAEDAFFVSVKTLRKSNASRAILNLVEECSLSGELSLSLSRTLFAMRSLQMCARTDLALAAHRAFWNTSSALAHCAESPSLTGEYVKWLCRNDALREAEQVVHRLTDALSDPQAMVLYHNAVTQLAVGQTLQGEFTQALRTLRALSQHTQHTQPSVTIPTHTATLLLKTFLQQCPREREIRELLQLLLSPAYTHALSGDADALQLLTSHAFAHIDFIKGAVSIETLPKPEDYFNEDKDDNDKSNKMKKNSNTNNRYRSPLPEFVFIGRSNVGKSSLLNTLTHRKGLAYTSKTPGKTSEFNYFRARGRLGRATDKDVDLFLVDVPGVGYAQRAKTQRESWTQLMQEYVRHRASSLRCVFHLVDSRHGLLAADRECLSLMEILPPSAQYVVVLTKVDKLVSSAPSAINAQTVAESTHTQHDSSPHTTRSVHTQFVSREIYDSVVQGVREFAGPAGREVPILLSSSQTRLGGLELISKMLTLC